METRNKTLNLFKTQVDGCDDIIEDDVAPILSFQEKLELRNSLLKRKFEMEEEMDDLRKRARIIQDKREVQAKKPKTFEIYI